MNKISDSLHEFRSQWKQKVWGRNRDVIFPKICLSDVRSDCWLGSCQKQLVNFAESRQSFSHVA